MTASQIFTAAHTAARVASPVVAYRTRFVTALKSAWAAAKQIVTTMSHVIEHRNGRVFLPYAAALAAATIVAAEVAALLEAKGKSGWARFRTLAYDALGNHMDMEDGRRLHTVFTAEEVYHILSMEMQSYAGYGASAAEIVENA